MSETYFEYRYMPGPDECEDLENYQYSGFHPVEIGDKFCNDKYVIVHKLGAGGAATVWLAQMTTGSNQQYVALKIMAAHSSSEDCNEFLIHKHLQKKISEGHKLSSVAHLLDSFWIEGPNGRHFCLASEASGPSLSLARRHERKLRPDIARTLALQTATGLQELHAAGVVYGDLSSNNLLFRLVDINSWTIEQLYERFGKPSPDKVQTSDGRPLDSHAPKFVYQGIQFFEKGFDYLQPELRFVDLADGRLVDETSREHASGFSFGYTAPETLWFKELQDTASDIWALACIFFELRAAAQLFEEFGGAEYIQSQVAEAIGPIPPAWLEKIAPGGEITEEIMPDYVPDEAPIYVQEFPEELPITDSVIAGGKAPSIRSLKSKLRKAWLWLIALFRDQPGALSDPESAPAAADMPSIPEYFRRRESEELDETLHGKIARIGKWKEWFSLPLEERLRRMKEYSELSGSEHHQYWHMTLADVDNEPPPARLSDEERVDFENLLTSILKFEKVDRLRLEDIIGHAWFTKSYAEIDDGPWLREYSQGWEGTMEIWTE